VAAAKEEADRNAVLLKRWGERGRGVGDGNGHGAGGAAAGALEKGGGGGLQQSPQSSQQQQQQFVAPTAFLHAQALQEQQRQQKSEGGEGDGGTGGSSAKTKGTPAAVSTEAAAAVPEAAPSSSSPSSQPLSYIGRSVAKEFEGYGLFKGIVTKHTAAAAAAATPPSPSQGNSGVACGAIVGSSGLWAIEYEDGDEEDLTTEELEAVLVPLVTTTKETAAAAVGAVPSSSSSLVGRSVLKEFDGDGFFKGAVTKFLPSSSGDGGDLESCNGGGRLWRVVYEDGDEEDLTQA
jgi:hypothetical protein